MSKRNALAYCRFLLLTMLLAFVFDAGAQAPALLNYQGVARNAAGVPLPNQNLNLRVNIRTGSASGQVVYSETRSTQTNGYGLFSVQIGSTGASSYTGTLASVNWAQGNMFMELELDPNGGSSFVNLGTTQLLSVPYALSALTAVPAGAAGGDLGGTYPNPVIADQAILTSKLGDLSVTDSKIAGVSGSKVTGDITGNAGNVTGIVAIANGGTGAATAAQARINLGITSASDSIRFKLNIADTAQMLAGYKRLNAPDSSRFKLNIADTAGMLSAYRRINAPDSSRFKLNIADTAGMLSAYRRINAPDSSRFKLNIADTAGMLSAYRRINAPDSSRYKLNTADTAAMLSGYRRADVKIAGADLATSYLPVAGGNLSGTLNGIKINLTDTISAAVIAKTGGAATQYLMADGSVSTGAPPIREVADEFTATVGQSLFTLSQPPGVNSKVKMYINGIRISNTAYSVIGAALTYTPANNGGYVLTANDRIQFDYHY